MAIATRQPLPDLPAGDTPAASWARWSSAASWRAHTARSTAATRPHHRHHPGWMGLRPAPQPDRLVAARDLQQVL